MIAVDTVVANLKEMSKPVINAEEIAQVRIQFYEFMSQNQLDF